MGNTIKMQDVDFILNLAHRGALIIIFSLLLIEDLLCAVHSRHKDWGGRNHLSSHRVSLVGRKQTHEQVITMKCGKMPYSGVILKRRD